MRTASVNDKITYAAEVQSMLRQLLTEVSFAEPFFFHEYITNNRSFLLSKYIVIYAFYGAYHHCSHCSRSCHCTFVLLMLGLTLWFDKGYCRLLSATAQNFGICSLEPVKDGRRRRLYMPEHLTHRQPPTFRSAKHLIHPHSFYNLSSLSKY